MMNRKYKRTKETHKCVICLRASFKQDPYFMQSNQSIEFKFIKLKILDDDDDTAALAIATEAEKLCVIQ